MQTEFNFLYMFLQDLLHRHCVYQTYLPSIKSIAELPVDEIIKMDLDILLYVTQVL